MQKNNVVFNILAFAVFSVFFANCTDIKDDRDNGAHSDQGALWFGPRLGKRSPLSAEENRENFVRLLEAADALKFYEDELRYGRQASAPEPKVAKKIIFTPKLGRSVGDGQSFDNVEFTPRLGRHLSDEIPVTPTDREIYQANPEVDTRSRYFSPRLGRTMNFSPRLGRELTYDYPTNIRVVRSANKTTEH